MTQIAVVYHSGYGHTERVAEFVAKGANAQLIPIDADGNLSEADWAHLHGHGLVAVQEVCRCHIEEVVHQCLEGQGGGRLHHLGQPQR